MLTQVDSGGFTLTMMEGVIGHYKDETTAISKEDKHYILFLRNEETKKDNHWLETLSPVEGWKRIMDSFNIFERITSR